MMLSAYFYGVIILLCLITIVTRALPFLFGKWVLQNKLLLSVATHVPASIIFLLLIYYIMLVAAPVHYHNLLHIVVALGVTLAVQWKWSTTILSLVLGVLCFGLLQNFV